MTAVSARRVAPHHVLLVEDSPELSVLMRTALETEGFRVDAARTAEDGLQLLELHRYDLVLTDYTLPGHNGAWLLREAHRRGTLKGATTLLVTAQPDAPDIAPDQDVITKPFNFDNFLPQIRTILAAGVDGAGDVPLPERAHMETSVRTAPPRVELVLYVSPASIACARAQRVMENMLRTYDPASIDFQVRDLTTCSDAAVRDRILYTPTLVKRSPPPSVWVLGDLSRPWIVSDLLQMCGISPVA